jgi:phosphoglycolate phosphatase
METENKYLEENPCHIGYAGIKEVLAELKKKYRLFIVSNSQCGYPDLCVEKLGLQDLIEGHLCFGDTGTTKGQTILTLMRKYGIASAAYIGDTQGDLDACEEAGIDFIWAAYGFGAPAHWVAKADSPQALLEIL